MRLAPLVVGMLLLAGPFATVPPPTPPCTDYRTGQCATRSTDGTGVDARSDQTSPGQDGSSGEGAPGSDQGPSEPRQPEQPVAENPEWCMDGPKRDGVENINPNSVVCNTRIPVAGEDPLPAVTITDVARFVPTNSSVIGEPGNVGVSRRATNFVADAGTTIVDGTLHQRAVSVQFTPIGFIFDYGDGTVVESATGGASWESLSLVQFTPTDTSHVYTERGFYTATVTVQYSAHVNFGTGWFYIPGTVTGPPASQSIQIFEARNMLVSKTCVEDPNGIGC